MPPPPTPSNPTLLACGSNGSGQLAIGHTDDVSTFTACRFDPSCPDIADVLDLVSAASHALILVRDTEGRNHLLGAGTNTHGQLGKICSLTECSRASTSFRPLSIARDTGCEGWTPVKIGATWTTSFVAFESVSGSSADRTQVIVSAGSDDWGELGGGSVRLQPGERVEQLRGGQRHVLAVVSLGTGSARKQRVIGWGAARKGELDPSSTQSKAHRDKGKGKGKGKARARTQPPTEIGVALPAPIIDIALGASHTLLLLADGHVMAWGSDLKGQISGLDSAEGIRAIGATWNGSYLLDVDNRLWSQGSNTHGQLLRSPPALPDDKETRDRDTAALSAGRTVVEIKTFAAGSEHILALALERDSTSPNQRTGLWAGGWNEHGNLGLGNTNDSPQLVETNVAARRVWAGCAASWALVTGG